MKNPITGKRLIELGFEPSALFGKAIHYSRRPDVTEDDVVEYIREMIDRVPQYLEPHESPVHYHRNIEATSELELSNLESVIRDMDNVMMSPTVVDGAIMPDVCPTGTYNIPVGGVAVVKDAIHPAMHSSDICCSVMASCYGDMDPKELLDRAMEKTHFGAGGRKEPLQVVGSYRIREEAKNNMFLNGERVQKMIINHMGTQGDGNHFLFVGKLRSTGETWLVTHHGSRGVGAMLYKKGMKVAEKFRRKISPNTHKNNAFIPYGSDEGRAYWRALQLVREWTYLNHVVIHNMVSDTHRPKDRFWNEHNFVFKGTESEDNPLFYHAKGATPMNKEFLPDASDNRRLIPLNMSQPILVCTPTHEPKGLGFAPHGAGRNYSRTFHKKSMKGTKEEIFNRETEGLDIRFFSGKIDISELPSAYKNADEIIDQIKKFNLCNVVDYIDPYGCIMAGEFTYNYKKRK